MSTEPYAARLSPPLHETHVCRDCGAEITVPFARAPYAARLSNDRGADAVHEAAQAFLDWYDQPGRSYVRDGSGPATVAALRAALSVPAPTLPALDVNAVAKGLGDWARDRHTDCGEPSPCRHDLSLAEVIFREALRECRLTRP